jgi:hypothetical protein
VPSTEVQHDPSHETTMQDYAKSAKTVSATVDVAREMEMLRARTKG